MAAPATDAAGVAGVPVVLLVLVFLAGEHDLLGVDDDDVVTGVDVRGVGRLVLAAEAIGDDRCEAADNQPVRVDHNPLLFHLAGFGGVGLHSSCSSNARLGCASFR